MNLIIGALIVALSVLGGYAALGGSVAVLWQPFEFVIIFGAAIGAYIIANPVSVLRDTAAAVGQVFRGPKYTRSDYLQLLSLLYTLFKLAKTKGLMHLERDIEHPEESDLFRKYPAVLKHKRSVEFLTDYLRLISLGSEKAHELESLMDEEIETISKELQHATKGLQVMGEGLPALGIIAAVLGVIKAMGAVNQPPETLGKYIAAALTGTFLGVILAYGLVTPLANLVKSRREAELNYYMATKAALLAFLNGYAPQICVEYARKVLYSEVQPSFYEVEAATSLASTNKAARTGEAGAEARVA